MKFKTTLFITAAFCIAAFLAIGPLLASAQPAFTSNPIDISSIIGPLDFAMASAPMIANMPIKAGGKTIRTGQPLPDLGDDADHFVAMEFCRHANAGDAVDAVDGKASKTVKGSGPGSEDVPSLADRIQTVLAENGSFDGLNMKKSQKLLGKGFEKTSRKELDAALALIKVDTPAEDIEVADVLETIQILAVELVDKTTGDINVDALKAELDTDAMPSDAAIAEAITQFKANQTQAQTQT